MTPDTGLMTDRSLLVTYDPSAQKDTAHHTTQTPHVGCTQEQSKPVGAMGRRFVVVRE